MLQSKNPYYLVCGCAPEPDNALELDPPLDPLLTLEGAAAQPAPPPAQNEYLQRYEWNDGVETPPGQPWIVLKQIDKIVEDLQNLYFGSTSTQHSDEERESKHNELVMGLKRLIPFIFRHIFQILSQTDQDQQIHWRRFEFFSDGVHISSLDGNHCIDFDRSVRVLEGDSDDDDHVDDHVDETLRVFNVWYGGPFQLRLIPLE
jgi:hypothetical protein